MIIHLGGDSLINDKSEFELGELKRITDQVFVLIDSERSCQGEPIARPRQAFVETCSKHGFKVHVTELRATENYLSGKAIKEVKSEKYAALGPYELLRHASLPWAKHENWEIAGRMAKKDLEGTDIDSFLSSL